MEDDKRPDEFNSVGFKRRSISFKTGYKENSFFSIILSSNLPLDIFSMLNVLLDHNHLHFVDLFLQHLENFLLIYDRMVMFLY